MNILYEHKFELSLLLMEFCDCNWEEAGGLCESEAYWEIDEEDFHEQMGDAELNPDNILEYFRKNPEYLEIITDDINSYYEFQHWNVNAWRNS